MVRFVVAVTVRIAELEVNLGVDVGKYVVDVLLRLRVVLLSLCCIVMLTVANLV